MSDATAKTIIVTVDGQPKEFECHYLSREAVEDFGDFVLTEARRTYNPWIGFANRIAEALTPELQAVAVRAFIETGDYKELPRDMVQAATVGLRATAYLAILVTGENFVTEANCIEASGQLVPLIHKPQDIVCESLEQANAIRAEAGKPPIGG